MNARHRFSILLVAVAIALSLSSAALACPGCKEATAQQGGDLAKGFYYSILFMMPLPFLIVGSFGGYVYYTVRKQRAVREATSTQKPSVEA